MNSSQTLPTPSSSFSTFQSPHSLPLHYSIDSPKPNPLSKTHRQQQSPLQPLQLNPSAMNYNNTAGTETGAFCKPHNQSSFNTLHSVSSTYPNSSAKAFQLPFQASSIIQKLDENSSLPTTKNCDEKASHQQPPEKAMGSIFSTFNKSSHGDKHEGISLELETTNLNKGKKEELKGTSKENHKEPIRPQSENSVIIQQNHQMSCVPRCNLMFKDHPFRTIEDRTNSARSTGAERPLQGLSINKDDHERFNFSPQERFTSDKASYFFEELKHESACEDNNRGRLRACSVGEGGIEGLEISSIQVLGPRSQNPISESIKIRMQMNDNHPTSGDLFKKKKARQCLNVLCFTDPKDPSLWSKQKVMNSTICKACFDAFKLGQYCYFCYQIYLDQETSASNDGKDWIECDGCNRWNHIECEAAHGLKEIRTLLQGHENTYSYFCPVCRNDKAAKAASKRMKALMRSPVLSKSVSCQKHVSSKRQQTKSQTGYAETIPEDPMDLEDNVDEPYGKKIKTSFEISVSLTENPNARPAKEKENTIPASPLDLAKKKLDTIYSRNQANKKKFCKTEIVHVAGHFSDIDRLMTQYAGKRVQLSEHEIKADLDLFRELSKSSTCHSEEKSNGSEFGMEISMELSEEKYKGEGCEERDARVRFKVQRKILSNRSKELQYYEEDLKDTEEIKDDDDTKGSDNFEPRRQLRSRKRLE